MSGLFLCVDVFIPKSDTARASPLWPEFLAGSALLLLGLWVRRQSHLHVLAILILLSGCTTTKSPRVIIYDSGKSLSFDVPDLLRKYEENNRRDIPVVSYMIHGTPQILIYADGRLITKSDPDDNSPSRLLISKLSTNDLNAILKTVEEIEGFHSLSNWYHLSSWSERPVHNVSVRLANRLEKTVSVYGSLEDPKLNHSEAPFEFQEMVRTLLKIRPKNSVPWDPGYIEVSFADYNHAPEVSLQWPGNWPSLTSPLVRDVHGWVIKKIMIFPSQHVSELDAFRKTKPGLRAVLINDWKSSVSYRWSLPGEKYWTSWNQ